MKSTTPKTVTITRNDLSRALKQPWSTTTCLLAQTAKRNGILFSKGDSPDPYEIQDASGKAAQAMSLFDNAVRFSKTPDASLLRRLKTMLPIKVRLS